MIDNSITTMLQIVKRGDEKMLNQLVLIGRLVSNLEKKETKDEYVIKLAVIRSFKNEDGIYETDIVPVILPSTLAERMASYIKKSDLICIKGIVQTNENQELIIVADKTSFLSAGGKEVEN